MYDGDDPETPVSDEERVIDCHSMGIVRWEVSQDMWDHLAILSEADRERILDIVADQIHEQCHMICAYVARFVARQSALGNTSSDEAHIGDSFPESWLHE